MRSAIVRRLLLALLAALALGGSVPLASRALYVTVAHFELDRLNAVRGDAATLEDDPLHPRRRARSEQLFELVQEADQRASAAEYAALATAE